MLCAIAAVGINNELGVRGDLPWHIPEDLAFFKRTTVNSPVIMGRNTYESVGFALPKRRNIIVSSKPFFSPQNCEITSSLETAIAMTSESPYSFLCGGAGIYSAGIPLCHRLYLTHINRSFDADTFFPQFDQTEFTQKEIANFVSRGPGNPRVRIVQYDRLGD